MGDAEASGGLRREAFVTDRRAARIAGAVGPVIEAVQGALDIGELGLDLLEDREVLLAFERVRPDVGLVHRHVRVLGPALVLGLVVEALGVEANADLLEAGALLVEQPSGVVGLHGPRS